MKTIITIAMAACALISAPAAAEVVSASPNAFHVRQSVPIAADAASAFAILSRPALWWSDAHTYSGDAGFFSLDLVPGGCLCETWGGGFVKHMEVVSMRPGTQIVMEGGLGPLRYVAASGTMTWEIADTETGRQFVIDYKVTGFVNGEGAQLAGAVDGVLAEQAQSFAATVAR
ncbi:SRPBCC family protein [Sphingomicrobium sp. XHP0239]|uniref:SRPBCC family protein n=1 Tax=Sphingomicrobium maritimum TaxID=3133972 RepID=UPI0031CC7717